MDYFKIIYTLLGGLGIFFLGMKFLSESLQSLGGGLIRRLITKATSNRIMATLIGILITTLIQSSSITTVMLVGLVNAGLMNLFQAIGVLFGANIGTTITGWILAIKVGKYGLLLVGLGFIPMLFSKKTRNSAVGKAILSLGFIFLGLEFMSGAFKPLRTNPDFLSILEIFHAGSFTSVLACVAVGCLLTIMIQSSSAMLGITIALASTGSITYPTAAALVMGENIGTTITALLAAIGTKTNAKRVAAAHAIFNVLGVCILIFVFKYYIQLIDYLIPGSPDFLNSEGGKPNIAAHIAAGHTIFNVTATLVALPFLKQLAKVVCKIVPDSKEKEVNNLKYLRAGAILSSGVSIQLAFLELKHLSEKVNKMLALTKNHLFTKDFDQSVSDEIIRLEEVTDNIQGELTTYTCQAMEGAISLEQSNDAYSIIKITDELESIADQAELICTYRNKLEKHNIEFSEEAWKEIKEYFLAIYDFHLRINNEIENDSNDINLEKYLQEGKELDLKNNMLKKNHLVRMREKTCKPISSMTYNDLSIALRRIKNHNINLIEALVSDKTQRKKIFEKE